MLLMADSPRALGVDEPLISFGEILAETGPWGGHRGGRALVVEGEPAFELSYWCGTCQFLFQRLKGASRTLSQEQVEDRLSDGISSLDESVIATFGEVLEKGDYLPLLLQIEPRLVLPGGEGDYFSGEQVATWGAIGFWGLPEYPRTPYYRTFETAISTEAHLYEFVVPMVPTTWNKPERVASHVDRLSRTSEPTAVAVSTLDVCAPAIDQWSTDYHEHWGLTHFLLDGHHKMQAAAEAGRPLQLLSLLSVDASLASSNQVATVPDLRAQAPSARRGS